MYNTGMSWSHGSRGRTGPWLSMDHETSTHDGTSTHGSMGRWTGIVVRSVGEGVW